jgi:hypothetical protein
MNEFEKYYNEPSEYEESEEYVENQKYRDWCKTPEGKNKLRKLKKLK